MSSSLKISTFGLFSCCIFLTGCATTTLIEKDNNVRTKTTRTALIEDRVVAFGKPAQNVANLASDTLVIAGQRNSYVLTQGGAKFGRLITELDPKNIQITKALDFYSPRNDGTFSGSVAMSYVKLKDEFSKHDMQFFIQNGATECSSESDKRMNAQRFCFDIALAGVVYPAASNLASLQALSKPYSVTIYTTQEEKYYSNSGTSGLEKLVLLPFAVAFDVVTLPFQVAEKIFD